MTASYSGELTGYQKRLFVLLSVATFFEGYDFMALAQLLPNLRADLLLSREQGGWLVAFVNLGTMLAYFLVRLADRLGRKRLLSITIVGYTLSSFASGLAPGAKSFAICQLLARLFLIAEWAVAIVYAAEEFPAVRRGMVIGVIQASASLGAILCSALVPWLLRSPWGWRTVYFVGALPLILIAIVRRNLRETARFASYSSDTQLKPTAPSLSGILRTPYRNRVLALSLIWIMSYCGIGNVITFWKDLALSARGLSDAQAGALISVAAILGMPLTYMVGKLLDRLGRRKGAVLIFVGAALGIWGSASLVDNRLLIAALTICVITMTGSQIVMNAFTAELFPTALRSSAFAWSNNLLGRIGMVTSPALVGMLAERSGYVFALQVLTVFPLLGLLLILLLLPETSGRELEDTSQLGVVALSPNEITR
ncbi:MAG TPA: MFS transporter [Pseudomonadota bacterium]|nr:MFS transporter [Pseudomonadota bacterium]